MRKIIANLLVAAIVCWTGYVVYDNYIEKCGEPIRYAVGSLDERFGISQDELLAVLQSTESVWEGPLETELFMYDPASSFKVNLVFDERQQRTIDEQSSRSEISVQEQEYRSLVAAYEAELAAHNQANAQYEAELAAYENRLGRYNAQVDYWNQNGGAPASEYGKLQQEKAALQQESNRLESRRRTLTQEVTGLNAKAAEINRRAQDLHLDVNAYNGKFGAAREFDQGNYTGNDINIFQFSGLEDLRLVVAHEFGHALGVDHLDNPESVMHYLMNEQNITELQATADDLAAVRQSCNL